MLRRHCAPSLRLWTPSSRSELSLSWVIAPSVVLENRHETLRLTDSACALTIAMVVLLVRPPFGAFLRETEIETESESESGVWLDGCVN